MPFSKIQIFEDKHTDEYRPAKTPTMIGNENALMEDGPKIKIIPMVNRVVNVVFSERVKVSLMPSFAFSAKAFLL